MAKTEPATNADRAEERRELWSDLPETVAPEDTTPLKDEAQPQPDLVGDPEHQSMITHAGG